MVYSPDQVKLKYVVQFTVEDDQLKEFSPAVNTTQEPVSMTGELQNCVVWKDVQHVFDQ